MSVYILHNLISVSDHVRSGLLPQSHNWPPDFLFSSSLTHLLPFSQVVSLIMPFPSLKCHNDLLLHKQISWLTIHNSIICFLFSLYNNFPMPLSAPFIPYYSHTFELLHMLFLLLGILSSPLSCLVSSSQVKIQHKWHFPYHFLLSISLVKQPDPVL